MIYFSNVWRRTRRRARLTVVALALAGTAAGLVVAAPLAAAHPGQPSAVFDPNEVGWAGVRDMTMAEFDAELAERDAGGYLPVDLEVDTFSGEPTFGGAFQANTDGRDWLVDTVMTEAEYEAMFADASKRGLRLVDREIYVWKGAWHHAAAWVENVEGLGWHAQRGLTQAQLNVYEKEQRSKRRMPIDFDMFRTPAGVRYSVVFLDNPESLDWHLHGDLTEAQFDLTFAGYAPTFRMLSFDSAPSGAQQLFGGIWIENANGRGWRMRPGMTAHSYANFWHLDSDEGYRQIFIGRYQTASGVRYATIWRQNSDRPNWPYKIDVEGHINGEMGEDDVPGVAVAVMQGGEFTFVRGFGHADIANDVTMDSGHVLRLASVSKAVGGALTMRLDERPDIDRDETADHYFPALPDHHDATLEQLAANRGCVRHYARNDSSTLEAVDPEQWQAEKDADDLMAQAWYVDARTASYAFHDDPLRNDDGGVVSTTCTPGDSSLYSTHGYTILAAALEEATGVGVKDLVRQEISEPLGLTTLRQEDHMDLEVRRAKLYDGADNEEVDADETTWKTLGGGLESDVRDLARFGRAVIQGQVYGDVEHVWGGGTEGWSYAYGWNLYDQDGHRAAGKSGGQLGSDAHLVVYPDDDTVVAVMINREELSDPEDHATDIAEYIGGLIV